MKLPDINMTLFFTGGVGLDTWARVGNLDREAALYKRLTAGLNRVGFVTYGGESDHSYADRLDNIDLYPTRWSGSVPITLARLIFHHRKMLLRSHLFKTNQIAGSEIPVLLKKIFRKKLIVRCGYLHARFAELSGTAPAELDDALKREGSAFEAADMGVVPTDRDLEWVVKRHGISREKLAVIPNYVDTETFAPGERESDPPFDLVFVGRSGRQKNLRALFAALSLLKAKKREVRLLLIGDCAGDDGLKALAASERIAVTFQDNVANSELPRCLKRARIFILPSLYEGHPKALIEAMSCRIPCIGTEVEGIRELLLHKETGYLCQTAPESMAHAIEALLSDKALQEKLGEAARRFVIDHYAMDKIVALELDVIRRVMEG